MTDFNNPQVAKLPDHLKQYIVDQHYEKYTPIDQAVWRYVMRQNYDYLKDVAFYPYIEGLKRAGLTIERIPDLETMNQNLGKIGWGAVTVDGFIPPAAFMEYQAYKVLVIAADIRQIKHIEYTPAPDIIHEASGHAPIIADKDYAQYLQYIGEIGSKAMFSYKDFELYEAIRHLSILKELPDADPILISEANKDVIKKQKNLGNPSEMALLSRLHWWTVEYGLIQTETGPKIYGAGLLSSIGESASCMLDSVAKIPYTIDAVNVPFDITQTQPQLFITPNFENLIAVLEEFANKMAFRTGGKAGLEKAIECKNISTAVLSSGIQISGVISGIELDKNDKPVLVQFEGNTALAYNNKEIQGWGKNTLSRGFISPIGEIKNSLDLLEDLSENDLDSFKNKETGKTSIEFKNGIVIEGIVKKVEKRNSKNIFIIFSNCTVSNPKTDKIYYNYSEDFLLTIGSKVDSVFCGAADKDAYNQLSLVSKKATPHQVEYSKELKELHKIYRNIAHCRINGCKEIELKSIWEKLLLHYPEDWLASMELYELVKTEDKYPDLMQLIFHHLTKKAESDPEINKLINDGFRVVENQLKSFA